MFGRCLGGLPEQCDEDALDDEFLSRDEVRVVGVFSAEEGFSFFHDEAFEGGFTVDEGGDDVSFAGFTEFEDHRVAIADVGVDHRVATDFECEGSGVAGDAEG